MELNYWLCLEERKVKCEVFLSLKDRAEEWMSDLADRKRPKSSRQHLCQARWMVPTQVPQGLRGGGALGLGLEG